MREIKIFLASSEELKNDRNSLQAFISTLDNIYEERGIRIRCRRWEDFPRYYTNCRTQDLYTEKVRSSDVVICMFHKKAGKYTIEEFENAIDEYKKNGEHPRTYICMRNLNDGDVEEQTLTSFKHELDNSIGHFWCNYTSDDELRHILGIQLDLIINEKKLLLSNNIEVKDGDILLHGYKISELNNLPFAYNNKEYQTLKNNIKQLDNDIKDLISANSDSGVINEKISERYEIHEKIKSREEGLLKMSIEICKMISRGARINSRLNDAIKRFNKGDCEGVLDILDADQIKSDVCNLLKEKEEFDKTTDSLRQIGNEMFNSRLISHINEYKLRINALITNVSGCNDVKIEEVCELFEEVINVTKKDLSEEIQLIRLFTILEFIEFLALLDKNYDNAENYCLEAKALARELANSNCDLYDSLYGETLMNCAAYYYRMNRLDDAKFLLEESLDYFDESVECKVKVAAVYTMLGEIYSNFLPVDIQNVNKSYNYYKKAIEIYYNVDSNVYNIQIANIYNSIGGLYYNLRDMNESHIEISEEYFKKAKIMFQEVLDDDVDNKYNYAVILNNLGSIYCFCKEEYNKAKDYYSEALDIYKNIKGFNPIYQEDLARLYRNLGGLYFKMGDLDESKRFYNNSLYEYIGLYDNNPILYEIELQRIYNELRLFLGHWYNDGQYDKVCKLSVLLHGIASHIYEVNKSETNIELYTDSLVNISYYLLLGQEYEKSEYYSRKALEVDPEEIYAFTNLAHALLLQGGKSDEAIEIYLKYKDTLKDDFINDLNELERLNIIPKELKEFVMMLINS